MPKLMLHGGAFAKGDGWFHADGRFVLRDKEGGLESLPLSRVKAAEHASEITLQIFGGDESLCADFNRAAGEGKAEDRMFIVCFDDGRLLLGATDRQTFEQICAPRERG